MERIGIYFKLLPDKQEEYKRRHDNIWPEISEALSSAGIHNYSIWNYSEMLFAYFEVEDRKKAQDILQKNNAYNQWRSYMEDIIDIDPVTGEKEYLMLQVFYHDTRLFTGDGI